MNQPRKACDEDVFFFWSSKDTKLILYYDVDVMRECCGFLWSDCDHQSFCARSFCGACVRVRSFNTAWHTVVVLHVEVLLPYVRVLLWREGRCQVSHPTHLLNPASPSPPRLAYPFLRGRLSTSI